METGILFLLLALLALYLWCRANKSVADTLPVRENGGAGGFGVISDLDDDSGFYIR